MEKQRDKLTKRQAEALKFIQDFIAKNGYSPSLDEIGKGIFLCSRSTTHGIVKRLQSKGYIAKDANISRAIRLEDKDDEVSRLRKRVAELEALLAQQRPDVLTIGKHDESIKAVISEIRMAVGD